jgi:hypothetical protein
MRVVIFRPSFFELAFWALISEIQLPRFRVRIVYSYTKTLEQGCVFAKHEARGGEPRTAKEETYQQCACTPPTSRSISYSCNLFRVANFTLPFWLKLRQVQIIIFLLHEAKHVYLLLSSIEWKVYFCLIFDKKKRRICLVRFFLGRWVFPLLHVFSLSRFYNPTC